VLSTAADLRDRLKKLDAYKCPTMRATIESDGATERYAHNGTEWVAIA
jgi:hypothetical protein